MSSEIRPEIETVDRMVGPAYVVWMAIGVICQCLMAMHTIREPMFPSLILAVAVTAIFLRRRADLGRPSTLALLLTILCVIKLYLLPYQPTGVRTFLAFPVAHAMSQGLMLWQAGALLAGTAVWLQYVPLVAAINCICLADVELTSADRPMFLILLLGMLMAFACGAHASLVRREEPRRAGRIGGVGSRRVIEGATLACVCLIVSVTVPLISRYWREVEQFLNDRLVSALRPSDAGFSLSAQLGSVTRLRTVNSFQPVARIVSAERPGYLRGGVYDRYSWGGNWQAETAWVTIQPIAEPISERASERVTEPLPESGTTVYRFDLRRRRGQGERQPDLGTSLDVWPEGKTYGRLLAPLEAGELSIGLDQVQRELSGVLALLPGDDPLTPYTVVRGLDEPARPAEEFELSRFLVISDAHRQALEPLHSDWAGDLGQGADAGVVIERLKERFQNGFRYSLSSDSPLGVDPVVNFLQTSRAGHCELFATATVLLLRMSGIPARYVTGLVVSEYSPRGAYWVGRQRDAHAWVEAWLPDQGWVTIDTTPGEGLPETTPPAFWSREWETLQWYLVQARAVSGRSVWAGLGLVAQAVFRTWPGFLLTMAFATWFVTRVLWPGLAKYRTRGDGPDAMGKLLAQVEEQLAARQLVRGRSETLARFAGRVEQAGDAETAAWLEEYARVRYSGEGMMVLARSQKSKGKSQKYAGGVGGG
jgi:protein-glutamine gamma-glutamyltransferase